MKLRNKKTGEIRELIVREDDARLYDDSGTFYIMVDSLAELNEKWEDYKPVEPLIKDEKIRKAVRAWAEADDLDNFRIQNQHFNACKIIGYTAGINKASFIGFQTTIPHADGKKLYTIDELCGEEETPEPLEPTFVDLDERIKEKEEE